MLCIEDEEVADKLSDGGIIASIYIINFFVSLVKLNHEQCALNERSKLGRARLSWKMLRRSEFIEGFGGFQRTEGLPST